MIRTLLFLLVVAFITAVAVAATGDAGAASVSWLGWRIDTTASAALVTVVFGALVATLIWQLLLWFLAAPSRAARARAETRRREGAESLARGFVAVAAGAGTDARRLAQKAADGWKFGPVKNPETREHPCFVPYAELPAAQQAKDHLFTRTVREVERALGM